MSFSGFDLKNDIIVCPPERNFLHDFYIAAKGKEWTESLNWMHPQNNHCLWYGAVYEDGAVTRLNLNNNGLSGKLHKNISRLRSLKVLYVSDNDIKVMLPLL